MHFIHEKVVGSIPTRGSKRLKPSATSQLQKGMDKFGNIPDNPTFVLQNTPGAMSELFYPAVCKTVHSSSNLLGTSTKVPPPNAGLFS